MQSSKILATALCDASDDSAIDARERRATESATALAVATFARERGIRYAGCTLDSFATGGHRAMSAAVKAIRELIATQSQESLLLYGPCGTGKDHLASAFALHQIRCGRSVRWTSGAELFGTMRDRMGSEQDEQGLITRYATPAWLYISDPFPTVGKLSDWQASVLYRILDRRYNNGRPIICTANVNGAADLTERVGQHNSERLRDGALAIHCDWPSYRVSRNNGR